MGEKLGKLLVELGIITEEQLKKGQEIQGKEASSIVTSLTKLGFVSEKDVLEKISRYYNMEIVHPEQVNIDPDVIKLIPVHIAQKFRVIPLAKVDRTVTVALTDPTDGYVQDAIKFVTNCRVKPVLSSELSVAKAIEQNYGDPFESITEVVKDVEEDLEVVERTEEEDEEVEVDVQNAPLVKLVNRIIMDGIKKGASDIHIEPFEKQVRIRYRIDGILIEQTPLSPRLKAAVTSRLKIMAKLDISERRIPLDGKIRVNLGTRTVDLRVSTCPTLFGEKVVMRILDSSNLVLDLSRLGFHKSAEEHFVRSINSPYGIVLVTGPTGSGKTTTLYSALSMRNSSETNIMTAEDPVEYNLPGINQVLVRQEIGLTFATALRAFLRQDPNIIMVGEIRDIETGDIAVKAALTGHLVLSTLHTNDAASTVTRMIDMGIPPFQVAAAVILILAQRLLRRLCTKCKIQSVPAAEVLRELSLTPAQAKECQFYQPVGCEACQGTGYKGRVGVYEAMPVTPALRRMILDRASTQELQDQATKEGMLTLRADALLKLKNGVTSWQQIIQETMRE